MLRTLLIWWQSLPITWRYWRIVGQVDAGDEVPERLPYRGVALVGATEKAKWAVFDCPCRTGHRLMLNLDTTKYPYWRIESQKPLTIWPSIDNVTLESRCHFTIRLGKITWAKDSRRRALK